MTTWGSDIDKVVDYLKKGYAAGMLVDYGEEQRKEGLERIAYWFGLYVFLYPACLK